jgi:glycosyltransferase involved in cell wall biosynthesis
LGALLSRRPAAILYNSHISAKQHETLGYHSDKRRIIPNGFDCEVFRPDPDARTRVRNDLGINDNVLVVGLIARYHPMKDHRNFLAAASIFHGFAPDARFVLAGAGVDPRNKNLTTQLEDLGLARHTYLLGERADVAALNASMDIATLSSAWGEGFPNVIGEAMACGVPCVVTDVGDSSFVVGDTGRVVSPRNPEALAHAWRELVEIGWTARHQLGMKARRRIQANFSLDVVVRQYELLYTELIEKGA